MSRYKGERKVVTVRLPITIIAKLDELCESTAGSRVDVVQALIERAEVQEVSRVTKVLTLRERGANDG